MFARSCGSIIERFPLQIYGAALVFCPTRNVIRRRYWEESPRFIKRVAGIRDVWDGCLQTLEGHTDIVRTVTFSPDGKVLASASHDNTIWLWDTATGAHVQTLEGHIGPVFAVAFSPNGETIASASRDKTVRLWETSTGKPKNTLEGHSGIVRTV